MSQISDEKFLSLAKKLKDLDFLNDIRQEDMVEKLRFQELH